jgi:hypothetical protein
MTYCWLLATEEDLEEHSNNDNSNRDQDSNSEVGLLLPLLNYILHEKQKERVVIPTLKRSQDCTGYLQGCSNLTMILDL